MNSDLIFFISIFLVRPLTVLMHELGHGIPALLLSGENTEVYVGSLGEKKGSVRIPLGKLKLFFKYNILAWDRGVCIPESKSISTKRQIIYTIAGPLLPAIVAGIVFALTYTRGSYSYPRFFIFLFLVYAVFDLIRNLTPSERPVTLADGTTTFNDGKALQLLFAVRRLGPVYAEALKLYTEQKYADATSLFLKVINKGCNLPPVYKIALSSSVHSGKGSLDLVAEFYATGKMDADDLTNAAILCSPFGKAQDARKYLQEALEKSPGNLHAIANFGYIELVAGNYEQAHVLFNRAVEINPAFAYSYSHRGLVKINEGDIKGGLEDIHYALNLNANEPYAHRNLGIYYIMKGERTIALEYLEKARELNTHTHMLDHYFQMAEELKHTQ